jgi:adenylate cyclase
MTLINPQVPARGGPVRLGFKASIIALFVAIVLVIGLTLVYLSFWRMTAITNAAASKFIDKVAELSADRIDFQLKLVRDDLEVLRDIPSVQTEEIADNPRFSALLAAMLRNNSQLFNLYVGYADGSFIEMDALDRAGEDGRASLGAPERAAFRLMIILRSGDPARTTSRRIFLSPGLETLGESSGPMDYDPRERPWYRDANRHGDGLTGPYQFFAPRKHGYTIGLALRQGSIGVAAGDILLDATEELLKKEKLTPSGVAFLFDDTNRILAHPKMSQLLQTAGELDGDLPRVHETDMNGVLSAINEWRVSGVAEQFFRDGTGRLHAAAFRELPNAGRANLRLAVMAPVDEFFANILSERRRLIVATLAFVGAMVPIVFFIGSWLAGSLRALADETDRIQRFEASTAPPVRSMIREIDELGRSVSTMRTVAETFSRFVPRRLVEQLIETGTPLQLGGTRREVTLLFSDVVNFTEITEKADPALVMQYTSRYFAAVSEEIMRHHGAVDKFIGDAIMAIWNAPADDPDHAVNACAGALAFQRANDRVNNEFKREGWPVYRTRCGLHTGPAVVGNVGSADRMNYTALGATVNLAARLEGLNKNYGTSILVSAALRERAASRFVFRSVDRISPKGFAEAFDIYELRCERNNQDSADLEMCRQWEAVYAMLRDGPEPAAGRGLAAFLARYPDDGVARSYARRRGEGCGPVLLQQVT